MDGRSLLRNILTLCFFGVPLISACNNETHHICVSGRECLPLEWRCDNVPDCPDGSDEHNCSYLHECLAGEFNCNNGDCVDKKFKCNGLADCRNGRDELGCEEIRQITHNPLNGMKVVMSSIKLAEVHEMEQDCDAGYHRCKSGPCIHGSMVCDGEVDCPLGDDEPKSCPPTSCPLNQIACGSSDSQMCIPRSWWCDDEPDCENGEDEKDCLHHEPTILSTPTQSRTTASRARTPSTTVTPTRATEASKSASTNGLPQKKDFENMEHVWVKCDAGSGMGTYKCLGENLCVNMTKTCDGQRDCPQGDDELGMCNECDHMRCSYKCQANVREARCVCPPGLVLSSKDRTTCVRYNACEDHSRCSHYCEPVGDKSYKCSCAVGYSLDKSGHRCMPQVDALAGELVVSTGNEVRISALHDDAEHHSSYHIYSSLKTGESMLHLSLDVRSQQLYMAIAGHQGEYQIAKTVRGQVSPLRRGINGLGNVQYDWVNENVFFVAGGRTEPPTIRVCMSDFRFCSRVLRSTKSRKTLSGRVEYPVFRGLAINPLRGLMCWIEVFHQTAKIKCGNVDGTGIFVLDDHKIEEPRALVIDHIRNDLYFADSELQQLDRINIDTHQRNMITRVRNPFDMAFFNGILYYSESESQSVKSIDVSEEHHFRPHIERSFTHKPFGLTINHTLAQPPVLSGPCGSMDCYYVCLAIPDLDGVLHAKCICPDEYTMNRDGQCEMRRNLTDVDVTGSLDLTYMTQLCEKHEACGANGGCVERHDERTGHVVDIRCECDPGYVGLECELIDVLYDPSSQSAESTSLWLWILFLIAFAIVCGIAYLYSKEKLDDCKQLTIDSMNVVADGGQRLRNVAQTGIDKIRKISQQSVLPTRVPTMHSFQSPMFNDDALTVDSPPQGVAPSLGVRAVFENFENPSFNGTAPIEVLESSPGQPGGLIVTDNGRRII